MSREMLRRILQCPGFRLVREKQTSYERRYNDRVWSLTRHGEYLFMIFESDLKERKEIPRTRICSAVSNVVAVIQSHLQRRLLHRKDGA